MRAALAKEKRRGSCESFNWRQIDGVRKAKEYSHMMSANVFYFLKPPPFSAKFILRAVQKTPARLRELATVLGASSHNLADTFLDNPVQSGNQQNKRIKVSKRLFQT